MQPVRLSLVLSILCGLLIVGQDAGARSLLNHIPGSDLMRELVQNTLGTFEEILDNQLSLLSPELESINPGLERLTECVDSIGGCPPFDPDAKRNVSEIIRSRGFIAEEYDVVTQDGYILTIQRIINPLVDRKKVTLKPVILQHGLMSSSVDWVINSVHVKPEAYPAAPATDDTSELDTAKDLMLSFENTVLGHQQQQQQATTTTTTNSSSGADSQADNDDQKHPKGLGFYLANRGYDVFLANSRGNKYGQRHVNISSWSPKFWDFTFDEQIKYDLPGVIAFVQELTKQKKVGYVGHSQGTTMILGLLADQPDYADIVEPVVLLAPVAYANNCISPVRYFAIYTPIFSHINMWFASNNVAVRYLAPRVCGPKMIRKEICENIVFLSTGFDEAEFDDTRVSAYMSHMPSGTSVKNIAHWGQAVLSGKFAHFDHGILANQIKYGRTTPPEYDLGKIRSKSIAMFTAQNDWLASPKDVAHLKADLKVPIFKQVNVSEHVPSWNHIDFVYGKDCGRLVNTKILEIFDHFKG